MKRFFGFVCRKQGWKKNLQGTKNFFQIKSTDKGAIMEILFIQRLYHIFELNNTAEGIYIFSLFVIDH